MSHLQDFDCMCGNEKFLNQTDIRDCTCDALVKWLCMSLKKLQEDKWPNRDRIIHKFIEISKEDVKRILFPDDNPWSKTV